MEGWEQQGVVGKGWTQTTALQVPTSLLSSTCPCISPKLNLFLGNGKDNGPALLSCEAQNEIIKVKAHFSLKSAVQIMSYH